MFVNNGSCMRVFRVSDDLYTVGVLGRSITGNLVRTVATLAALGVDDKEIEFALTELARHDHDVAEFGIQRMFMFTREMRHEDFTRADGAWSSATN